MSNDKDFKFIISLCDKKNLLFRIGSSSIKSFYEIAEKMCKFVSK